ncbi:peptide ABC transporter substrate-binding protein [Clostridia bacterium]|nr:peptide ABC transporter substrate-binding protein [Clostridia bacterium]
MKKKYLAKFFSFAMVAVLGLSLAACGGKKDGTEDITSQAGQSVPENPIVWRTTISEVSTLSPFQFSMDTVNTVLGYALGRFYDIIYDEATDNMKFIPSQAEDMPKTDDNGKTWTIKLREGLHFTNGHTIDANTFDYTWKELLDPKLENPNASSLYSTFPIVNAEAYYLGLSAEDYQTLKADENTDWDDITPSANPVSWEDVGIKVVDDHTLQFTLDTEMTELDAVSNFTGMTSTAAVDPEIFEACFNEDRSENTYGLTLDTLAQSGRWQIVDWQKDQYLVFEKNYDYPTASVWTPDVIELTDVPDSNTEVQMFKNGELDRVALAADSYEQFKEDPRLLRGEGPVVWGFYLNGESTKNPILQDSDFRHALFYAVNRESIATDIYKIYLPADYFISRRAVVGDIFKDPERYRDTEQGKANEAPNYGFDEAKAKELFDKAYAANGNQKVTLELIYFEGSASQKKTAEFLKEDYERIFGADKFELAIKSVPTQAAYAQYESKDYDAGFGTMGQDSFNPWASLEIWRSNASEKVETFKNPEFDKLQAETSSGDLVTKPKERLDALGKMEGLLLDYMPWIPIYQNDGAIVYADRVHIKPKHYLTSVAFAELQADIDNDVPRSIIVNK